MNSDRLMIDNKNGKQHKNKNNYILILVDYQSAY